ncbi:uncharacterized protein LOC6639674 isoform X1 [Drosophila willistoni]|uniref:uncharacterized protein LOC6639674 isoform X1 n=1 Tax=Drosophila willistoni TaxID=7260 RepID=UPI00017D6C23|nr:uncharacterized protein LOC6639674 isoform X1 [Drosophila willistoni]
MSSKSKAEQLHKQTLRDKQKRIKPGECQKYVRIVLDGNLTSFPLGQDLIKLLSGSELKYVIRQLPLKNCIVWERNVGQLTLATATELDEKWEIEKHVVKILKYVESCVGLELKAAFPDAQYTVVATKPLPSNTLIDLQLLQNLHVEQLGHQDQAKELHDLLQRQFKAIAEAPYKHQKNAILSSFKKYLANDKKQCVKVEGGNGFKRLWQQHLNRLPLVTLDIADSIISQYSCPRKMILHFRGDITACETLANVRIKRGQGPQPMQTEKRIGNVLSSKLYTLYNARDENSLL